MSSRSTKQRVWLDLDIGCPKSHAQAQAEYAVAVGFLRSHGAQYGLCGTPEGLSEEGRETCREAVSCIPDFKGRTLRFAPPPPLSAGRIVIELEEATRKTSENFRCLVTGEKGTGKGSKKPLHYKGVCLHRIVKGFVAQGGDVVKNDGSAGESIYGMKFNDEKPGLKMKHDVMGVISMANSGKNSNSSQFFFTLGPAPQLDGKHVVFGRVVEGLDILDRINAEAASDSGEPRVPVIIQDCGECASG